MFKKIFKKKSKKKVALSMRGGGARCAAYIGVLRAFEENDIKVDMIAGASGGAVVAGAYSFGIALDKIVEHFIKYTFGQYFGWDSIKDLTLLSDDKTIQFMRKLVGNAKIEDLPIELLVQATNLDTGIGNYFTTGDLALAIIASSSMPIITKPVEIDGVLYCDGGISSSYAVEKLKEKGADVVIGLISSTSTNDNLNGIQQRIIRPFDIMGDRIRELDQRLAPVDLLIDKLGIGYSIFDNIKSEEIAKQGYERALELMPEIKKLLD